MISILGWAAVAALAVPAAANPVETGVPRVGNGKSLWFDERRVQLHGIDVPHALQSCFDGDGTAYRCGVAAAEHLHRLAGDRTVTCYAVEQARLPNLARCFVGGVDLGARMVEDGRAVATSADYAAQEAAARAARAGLWAGRFVRPDAWRESLRSNPPIGTVRQ